MKPIAPMKPELHAIVARVEQVRKELDLSKSALARLIGMKPQTYNNFIGGQGSKPSVELVLGIVDKCGVHADWLLRGVGDPWRDPPPNRLALVTAEGSNGGNIPQRLTNLEEWRGRMERLFQVPAAWEAIGASAPVAPAERPGNGHAAEQRT